MPALVALIAGNYEGKERNVAYAVIGGVAGAGIAIGPILGGWATTELSWRIVFVGEVVLVLVILAMSAADPRRRPARPDPPARRRRHGPVGVGPRPHRARRPAVQHLGLDQAQSTPPSSRSASR